MAKRFIQRRSNVTKVLVEPRSYDQVHRKNDAFTHGHAADNFLRLPHWSYLSIHFANLFMMANWTLVLSKY